MLSYHKGYVHGFNNKKQEQENQMYLKGYGDGAADKLLKTKDTENRKGFKNLEHKENSREKTS
jgi:hypothetical protein